MLIRIKHEAFLFFLIYGIAKILTENAEIQKITCFTNVLYNFCEDSN